MVLVLLDSVYEGRREKGGRWEGRRRKEDGEEGRREEEEGRREEGGERREGEKINITSTNSSLIPMPCFGFVLKSCTRPGNKVISMMIQS